VSAACEAAGHPNAAKGAEIVQHVATAGAAVAGTASVWQERTKQKAEEEKKADEEKGKETEAPKKAIAEAGTQTDAKKTTEAGTEAPKKVTADASSQTDAEKTGKETDAHDLLNHDAKGAPKQQITVPPLEPEVSSSGTKKEEKPAVPAKPETPETPAVQKPTTPAPAPAAKKPTAHKTNTL
jgi:hypothetical protein